jgi:flagellar protein FlgJ
VAQWTLESIDGALTRQRAQFRAYSSPADSFDDYASLIAESPRYARAVDVGAEAVRYVHEVVAGGYATDPDYADKWLSIYRGELLRGAVQAAQGTHFAADTMAASAGD